MENKLFPNGKWWRIHLAKSNVCSRNRSCGGFGDVRAGMFLCCLPGHFWSECPASRWGQETKIKQVLAWASSMTPTLHLLIDEALREKKEPWSLLNHVKAFTWRILLVSVCLHVLCISLPIGFIGATVWKLKCQFVGLSKCHWTNNDFGWHHGANLYVKTLISLLRLVGVHGWAEDASPSLDIFGGQI